MLTDVSPWEILRRCRSAKSGVLLDSTYTASAFCSPFGQDCARVAISMDFGIRSSLGNHRSREMISKQPTWEATLNRDEVIERTALYVRDELYSDTSGHDW